MSRMIVIAVIAGLVSGLLVGGFHNLFTVPVMERAIILEEERAAAESKGAVVEETGGTPVSLGVQRIGMAVGTTIYGGILGLVFTAGYTLLRRIVPQWRPVALAATISILGFWALSLFPFIKFPLNPPGVGDESTLLMRQLYQTSFIVLSALAIAGLLFALGKVDSFRSQSFTAWQMRGILVIAYGIFAAVIFLAIPGNPDPVPVPIDLLELFRALTMAGQFLLWALLAAGVAGFVTWRQPTNGKDSGTEISPVNSGAASS